MPRLSLVLGMKCCGEMIRVVSGWLIDENTSQVRRLMRRKCAIELFDFDSLPEAVDLANIVVSVSDLDANQVLCIATANLE